ncbi:MAG: DUF433 domain-containing protein [Trueperaceae bacterium]
MAIEVNPKIMLGKPVIQGTRVTVELILRKISEGMKPENIVEAHPSITVENVYEAVAYAAKVLAHEELRFA